MFDGLDFSKMGDMLEIQNKAKELENENSNKKLL